MKKAFLLVMLLCAGTALWAQKLYFIYIQSESGAPFYVKMGDKVFSASSSGYLILSRLHDSTYNFYVGPSAADGELQFSVPVRQSDRGFLLKKFAEGWGLFDLQSMQVLRPVTSAAGLSSGVRVRDDRFTSLLAEAADDTTLFYQPVVASAVPAKKVETAKAAVKTAVEAPATMGEKEKNEAAVTPDTAVAVQTTQPANIPDSTAIIAINNKDTIADVAAMGDPIKDTATAAPAKEVAVQETREQPAKRNEDAPIKAPEVAAAPANQVAADTAMGVFKKSKVQRRAEGSTVDGFSLVFWDDTDGVVDTIKIFIPNQKFVFAEKDTAAVETVAVITTPEKASGKKQRTAAIKPANETCSGKASDKDFFRLRKTLVAYDSETEMVIAAKNNFRQRCFSATQIKDLSTLFLTQEGKWLFFEAAYPYAADKTQFAGLQSELRDEPYLGRFKAMVGK